MTAGHDTTFARDPIPVAAGIGLRAPHYADLHDRPGAAAWLEVHPENYMGAGGPPHLWLTALRADHPLSLHGVGLSPGSAEPVDADHLARLRALVDRYQPDLVSEHVAWSRINGVHLNDLLPLPLTPESLAILCCNVDAIQNALGRQILMENPSTYLTFTANAMPEPEFLAALCRHTGCGLLLDVNNLHVCATNHGFDARDYLDRIPAESVGEIHLAGHAINDADGTPILIDDHGSRVAPAVWALYREALARTGPVPTLVEWDTDIPALDVLLAEADRAQAELDRWIRDVA